MSELNSKPVHNTYLVKSSKLAKEIIDKGFFKYLCGVKADRDNPTKRVYFFEKNDKTSEIKFIIAMYYADLKVKNGEMVLSNE